MKKIFFLIVAIIAAATAAFCADLVDMSSTHIISFASRVAAEPDRRALISERITLNVADDQTVKGIDRVVPEGSEIIDARIDGAQLRASIRDGKIVATQSDALSRGVHIFDFVYRVPKAFEISGEYDILLMEPIGTWTWPIDRAALTIFPPAGAQIDYIKATVDKADLSPALARTDDGYLLVCSLDPGETPMISARWRSDYAPAFRDERVADLSVRARVDRDGSVSFVERIEVNSLGREIKRGITRSFPTMKFDASRRRSELSFELESATLDGEPVPHTMRYVTGGVEASIAPTTDLSRGVHVFELKYRVVGLIYFEGENDELFWTVTGSGWPWRIDRASMSVELPDGVSLASSDGFVSKSGEMSPDVRDLDDGSLATTRALSPGENFGAIFAWPTGAIAEPSMWLAHSKEAAGFFAAIVGYFAIVWLICGRDAKSGDPSPTSEPPDGVGPGFASYLKDRAYSNRCITSELVRVAAIGGASIAQVGESVKISLLESFDAAVDRAAKHDAHIEDVVRGRLFSSRAPLDPVGNADDAGKRLVAARDEQRKEFAADGREHFTKNTSKKFFGALLILAGVIWSALFADFEAWRVAAMLATGEVAGAYILYAIAVFASGVSMARKPLICAPLITVTTVISCMIFERLFGVALTLAPAWSAAWAAVMYLSVLGAAFVGSHLSAPLIVWISQTLYTCAAVAGSDKLLSIALVASVGAAVILSSMMTRRTEAGAATAAQLRGLELFMLAPPSPKDTPQLFEKLLPYAYALGCADAWVDRFGKKLAEDSWAPKWFKPEGGANFSAASMHRALTVGIAGSMMKAMADFDAAKRPGRARSKK